MRARILGEAHALTTVGLGQAGRIPRERRLGLLPQHKVDSTRMGEGRALAYDGLPSSRDASGSARSPQGRTAAARSS